MTDPLHVRDAEFGTVRIFGLRGTEAEIARMTERRPDAEGKLHWPLLAELGLFSRVLVSTLALTPLMVYLFIPLSTHLLAGWLNPAPPRVKPAEATV